MLAQKIRKEVVQMCWGVGHYREPQPILDCMEHILTNWPYSADVDVFVSKWEETGVHLHTKALVKIGSGVYSLILSETCEPDVLIYKQNDITYLLASVIEETEEELARLRSEGVEVIDPLSHMLQEMEQFQAAQDQEQIRE
ncbi:hypothetical protein CBW65_01385 [Tumebacillus avium]|uniref:Uncharacterized protein n=1 Tax=Tumebacillus avium TaxID=1903704 RepID=A0A1Y0IK15_9BACL|nr:hypothetical protein [Tumebacillus avium]ARU59855.1 hypothetical protein CBW65_01385 [Tumebacillus avium]